MRSRDRGDRTARARARAYRTAAFACAALLSVGCQCLTGDIGPVVEAVFEVMEPVCEMTGEALVEFGEFVEEAYSTGDVSFTAGGMFAHGDEWGSGYCADLQVRGHCARNVTFDMGLLAYSVGDGGNVPRIRGSMFTVAVGGDTELYVTAEKTLPFRIGLSGVVAFPLESESSGGEYRYSTLGGAKLRIDWVPVTDWRDPWPSGLLEIAALGGMVYAPDTSPRDGDAQLLVMVKGGVQYVW